MVSPSVTQVLRQTRFGSARMLQVGAVLALAAIWEGISASGLVYRGVLPSLMVIAAAWLDLMLNPAFWPNVAVTLAEIACALLIGSILGTATGLLMGSNRLVAAGVEPLVNSIASTPKVIFLPLMYLAFGVGMGSKIAAGALACFFPMAIGVTTAVLNVNPTLVRVGKSFGLSSWQMICKIYLPSLIDPLANGLRIALGVAIGVCLIAETRFSFAGLGFMVVDSYDRSRFPQVYAVLIVIVGLAVSLNALVNYLQSRLNGAGRLRRARAR